jgi:formiminoglutamase
MLHNWLSPLKADSALLRELPEASFGRHVTRYHSRLRSLEPYRVALIGLDAEIAEKIRKALYPLSWHFGDLAVIDLGDVRNSDPEFVVPLLKELTAGELFPILIGGPITALTAQYKALLSYRKYLNLVLIDDRLGYTAKPQAATEHYLNDYVHGRRASLFHLGVIGPQLHHIPAPALQLANDRYFEITRLGQAQANLTELEPALRDADLCAIHLNAVRQSDAPARAAFNPSGFRSEEVCQLARYAGMSDKLSNFGVYGLDPDGSTDREQYLTAATIAQILWYFIEGFSQRKGDFPVTTEGLTEYIVDSKTYDRVTFWRSQRSSRWWIQAPVRTKRGQVRHRLIPCSYEDYLTACREELPPRLLNAFRRFQ